jgi:hypothetical protein
MLARTKGIGAGGFRARPADGALAATGGASPSPRWDGLLGRIGGRRAPRPSIKVRQQLPGRARYVAVVGRQEPAVRAPRAGLDTVPRPSVTWRLPQAGHHTVTTQSPRRVTPTATTSATRSRARSAGRRRQPLPGRRRQVQVERASVEHRERVLGVVGGRRRRSCRRRVRLASAGQVSSWNTVSRFPPRRSAARCRRSSRASSAPCSLNNTTNGPITPLPRLRRPRQIPQRPTPTIRTGGPPGGTDRLNHPHRRITRQRRTPRPWT